MTENQKARTCIYRELQAKVETFERKMIRDALKAFDSKRPKRCMGGVLRYLNDAKTNDR